MDRIVTIFNRHGVRIYRAGARQPVQPTEVFLEYLAEFETTAPVRLKVGEVEDRVFPFLYKGLYHRFVRCEELGPHMVVYAARKIPQYSGVTLH